MRASIRAFFGLEVRLWLVADVLCRKFEFGDNSTAIFHIGVLLDPLSETAQKWAPLLEVGDSISCVVSQLTGIPVVIE